MRLPNPKPITAPAPGPAGRARLHGTGAVVSETAMLEPAAAVQQRALQALARRAGSGAASMIGLDLALPFCAVHCLCCDRDVHAGQPARVLHSYVQHLGREIDLMAQHAGSGHELMQLRLGGGTANLLDAPSLAGLMHRLRQHWRIPTDAELSVECDPRLASSLQLELLHGLGFEELRFGVLDLAPAVQRAIGRLHSRALVDDACQLARDSGFDCVHLELMVGLPEQTRQTWHDTLHQVVAMAPARISLRRYRHRPWQVPGQCAIDAHALPGPAAVRDLVAQGAEVLGAVGYRWLGADLFVLEDDPLSLAADAGQLRGTLIGHTGLPPMPLLGLGRGAVSDLGDTLVWNIDQLAAWQAEVASGRLPVAGAWEAGDQARRRRVAAELLLCQHQLPATVLADDLAPLYAALAVQAPAGGLLRLPDRLVLTAAGRLDLPDLCAGLAGLPAGLAPQLPARLPAWLG